MPNSESRSPSSTRLNDDMDAQRWTREFLKIWNQRKVMDEGWMLSWFANAIMCGYDIGRQKLRAELASSESGRNERLREVVLMVAGMRPGESMSEAKVDWAKAALRDLDGDERGQSK